MKPSRKAFLLLALVLSGLVSGVGASLWTSHLFSGLNSAVPEPETTPQLSFDSLNHDFGMVRAQTSFSHDFTVTNSGSQPIRLRVDELGCNCIALDCPNSVAPGSSAVVTVRGESRNREGSFATHVNLGTSDPALSEVRLMVRFYVQPTLDADPPSLDFLDVARGAIIERDIVIRRIISKEESEAPSAPIVNFPLPALKCQHVNTHVSTDRTTGLRRAIHRFHLRLDTGGLPSGSSTRFRDDLQIWVTDAPEGSAKKIPVEVVFRHHPGLGGQISVTVQRRQGASAVKIRLWSVPKTPFAISKVTASIPGVSARVITRGLARTHEIQVTAKLEGAAGGLQKGALEIYSPQYPKQPYHVDVLVLP